MRTNKEPQAMLRISKQGKRDGIILAKSRNGWLVPAKALTGAVGVYRSASRSTVMLMDGRVVHEDHPAGVVISGAARVMASS